MKKALKLLATVAVLTVLLIPTGCIMLVGGDGDTYYGFRWTANLDSFENSADTDSIKIKNTLGEQLTVKYKIFLDLTSDNYDKIIEPDWNTLSVSQYLPAAPGLVEIVSPNEIPFTTTYGYAIVWIRVQNADNSKYLNFSVQLFNSANAEWNITISKEN